MKRMKRQQPMTGRERKAAEIEKTRRMIYAMHLEGAGYASIARVLNERKIPSRRDGKWNKSMVKRELEGVLKGTQKCPLSPSVYTKVQMQGESAERLSLETAAAPLQDNILDDSSRISSQAKDMFREEVSTREDSTSSQSRIMLEEWSTKDWSTPGLIEMPYTGVLRKLYLDEMADAA
jgi:hypothetical protein